MQTDRRRKANMEDAIRFHLLFTMGFFVKSFVAAALFTAEMILLPGNVYAFASRLTLQRSVVARRGSMRMMTSSESRSSTVAVVGSGAVGGYYGTRLWEAGHNVKFHMRGEHYSVCTEKGLKVTVSNRRV